MWALVIAAVAGAVKVALSFATWRKLRSARELGRRDAEKLYDKAEDRERKLELLARARLREMAPRRARALDRCDALLRARRQRRATGSRP